VKTNAKRIIATLVFAITYLVVGPYFFTPRFIVDETSEIFPFIFFCIFFYLLIFGLWDSVKYLGFWKVLGITILAWAFLIATNHKQINASLFCTNNPKLPLCSRTLNNN
tara:strand:+ start:68 stop:394 length:327 start_codon:yes stop_codon:yes gene_type:complete